MRCKCGKKIVYRIEEYFDQRARDMRARTVWSHESDGALCAPDMQTSFRRVEKLIQGLKAFRRIDSVAGDRLGICPIDIE